MALITAAAGGGNWTTGGTWVGGVAPTAVDDALLTAASGNVTIDSGAVCRSLDCNTYTGTLTHNAITCNIGDGTAGTGNIALRLVSGMTYTKVNASTSAFNFISTSATVQTVTSGGKTLGNTTFNAASNGSWQLSGAFTCAAATLTLTKGTLDTNGQSVTCGVFTANDTNVKTLTLGASAIAASVSWALSTSSNTTFNANTSAITVTATSVSFTGGNKTYNNVTLTGMTITNSFIAGANTFANLTLSNNAVKTTEIAMQANQTISSTLTITGNSAINRLLIKTDALGTSRTLTAATVTASNCDFMDITGAGAASWNLSAITGNSGDCGGNSGITFTTGATQTATGTASFTWSTHGWTSRVPLPQDDVVINNAFVAGRVVTQDMPRAGKSINFTGATGTPTFTPSVTFTLYGSLTLISGMTVTAAGTNIYIFGGRGAFTITTAGKTVEIFDVNAPGGSLTLQDNLTSVATTTAHNLRAGTLDFNNFNVTMSRLSISGSITRTLTLGSGTLTLAGTGSVFVATVVTSLTVTATTGTIKITDTSATARTFSGGGKTYGNFWSAAGASTASLTIAGSNTFTDFKDTGTAAHSILFTAGTTQTVTTFTVSGSSGNLISIDSTTTATHALVKAGGGTIGCDYLDIQHSVATPSSTWYAGTHSTNDQAVATAGSGWTFTDAPAGGVSGTSAQTLPNLDQAAEGDVLIQGTSAQTLPRFSESGSGATSSNGVGAQVLSRVTQSAEGLVPSASSSVGQGAGPSEVIYEETRKRKTIRVTRALKKLSNKYEKGEVSAVDIQPLVDILLEPYGQAYLLRQIQKQIENQNLQLAIYDLLESALLDDRMRLANENIQKYASLLSFVQREKEERLEQREFEELLLLIL